MPTLSVACRTCEKPKTMQVGGATTELRKSNLEYAGAIRDGGEERSGVPGVETSRYEDDSLSHKGAFQSATGTSIPRYAFNFFILYHTPKISFYLPHLPPCTTSTTSTTSTKS